MKIGLSVRKQGNWKYGFYKDYRWYAKTYIEQSPLGINNGQVSKLYVYTPDDECICLYDRGWVIEPNKYAAKLIYHSVIKLVSNLS